MEKKTTAEAFFTKEEQEKIILAIQKVEQETSAEIRLHIDTQTSRSALDRSAQLFGQLKMHKTAQRNGVLLYMAIQNKYFALIGDAGIHLFVKDTFWKTQATKVLEEFKKGNFLSALITCIEQVGKELKTYFPHQKNDKNELPDELSFN